MTPYMQEIRSQPEVLATLLEHDPASEAVGLDLATFPRVILSGMGASHYATYPAWLTLVQAGVPAWWIETDELLHHARGLIRADSLLWLTSQSGYSAEITALLEFAADARPRQLLALTNDPESPLARAADRVVEIHAGHEDAVSTKSYVNSLVAAQLLALRLIEAPDPRADLDRTITGLDAYLGMHWDEHLTAMEGELVAAQPVIALARGATLHAAWTGALILKEAARCNAEGMSAGQFRHGPLELAGPGLTTIIVEGAAVTATLNRSLAEDLAKTGTHVLWMGAERPEGAQMLPVPPGWGVGERIAEIVPFQMLTVAMARLTGVLPGVFQYATKVTAEE